MKCEQCGQSEAMQETEDPNSQFCKKCRDRNKVREAFDEQLLTIARLERRDPERALATLEGIWSKYASIDHDNWLNNTIRAHRAHIFSQNKRFDDALVELRQLSDKLNHESDDFVSNQLAIAANLQEIGAPDEAIKELDIALSSNYSLSPETTLGLLSRYATISHKINKPVPDGYLERFEKAVTGYGIEVPQEARTSLSAAIAFAAKMRKDAQDRYASLSDKIKSNSPDKRIELIRSYIESEPVGFFRYMAQRSLDPVSEEAD
jgi:tetratricopeptide (TPR) repeat protein